MKEKEPHSFWSSLPGIITSIAALVTAFGGLILALNQFGGNNSENGEGEPRLIVKPENKKEIQPPDNNDKTPGEIATKEELKVSKLVVNSPNGSLYEVKYHGLIPKSRAAADRPYLFKNVPPFLNKATYIPPSHSDKNIRSSDFMSFSVNKNVTIYIAYDIRYKNKPNWLAKSFEDTGLEWQTGVQSYHTYRLYKKNYTPGHILLGGNIAPPAEKGSYSTYTVIVVD